MAEPTQDTSPRTSTRNWCHWHEGPSETAVLVAAHERNSGPPFPLYACAPCREQRGLVPLADRP